MSTSGFVPEPDCGRGTIGILWSCLTTIFLTTWTALHFRREESSPKTQLRIFAGAVVLPELAALEAINHFWEAWSCSKILRKQTGWENWSLQQSFAVASRCVFLQNDKARECLEPARLIRYAKRRVLSLKDLPSDEDWHKRAQQDWAAKAISIVQTVWFAANTLARAVQRLPVSPIEDITIAYVFCGLLMFLSWFRCPKNVFVEYLIPQPVSDREPPPVSLSSRRIVDQLIGPLVVVFAGIHLATWGYAFPTTIKSWIWRSASLGMVVAGALITSSSLDMKLWKSCEKYFDPNNLAISLYYVCRLIGVILALIAFRRAPAALYVSPTWPSYWVHLGG